MAAIVERGLGLVEGGGETVRLVRAAKRMPSFGQRAIREPWRATLWSVGDVAKPASGDETLTAPRGVGGARREIERPQKCHQHCSSTVDPRFIQPTA
jgi:hypothetical protein